MEALLNSSSYNAFGTILSVAPVAPFLGDAQSIVRISATCVEDRQLLPQLQAHILSARLTYQPHIQWERWQTMMNQLSDVDLFGPWPTQDLLRVLQAGKRTIRKLYLNRCLIGRPVFDAIKQIENLQCLDIANETIHSPLPAGLSLQEFHVKLSSVSRTTFAELRDANVTHLTTCVQALPPTFFTGERTALSSLVDLTLTGPLHELLLGVLRKCSMIGTSHMDEITPLQCPVKPRIYRSLLWRCMGS